MNTFTLVRAYCFSLYAASAFSVFSALVCATALPIVVFAQSDAQSDVAHRSSSLPTWFRPAERDVIALPAQPTSKAGASLTGKDWRTSIDAAWGAGASSGTSSDEQQKTFQAAWQQLDQQFACFNNFPLNWDSLKTSYQREIAAGVSRGRFAAMMNHLALALRESHTFIGDAVVNYRTKLLPGTPLMVAGAWGDMGHFGAGLTPLPDSSLLVYSVAPNHPLGLKRGDVVWGYNIDGKPVAWKQLYRELLAAQLPLTGWWWGSSASAFAHSWLVSAGMNWHLFENIIIVKQSTGDTVTLSTAPLAAATLKHRATEQMPVDGVSFPLGFDNNTVSFGIINGSRIGYIYVWGWTDDAQQAFYNAVATLQNRTDGLILDFRTNYGGNTLTSNAGLELLFGSTTETVAFARRASTTNRFEMTNAIPSRVYAVPSNGRGYTKPIAVLVGPGCVSAGDQVALRMKLHPRARTFGKATSGAFNGYADMNLPTSNFDGRFAGTESYLATSEAQQSPKVQYLTRSEFPVDEAVWLTREGVMAGRDDVVDAALRWITRTNAGLTNILPADDPKYSELLQAAPNPASERTTLHFQVSSPSHVTLTLFDAMGRAVRTLADAPFSTGIHLATVETTDLPAGLYSCRLQLGSIVVAKSLLVTK
jgi:hypothetical protein